MLQRDESTWRVDKRCTFRGGPMNNRKMFIENHQQEVRCPVQVKNDYYVDDPIVPEYLSFKEVRYLRVKMGKPFFTKNGWEFWWEFWEQSYHDKRRKKEESNGPLR